ncbi:hypothetical protein Hanom_Chr13g01239871 [Helianthus anomalus]
MVATFHTPLLLHAAMYIPPTSKITPTALAVLVLPGALGRHALKITIFAHHYVRSNILGL